MAAGDPRAKDIFLDAAELGGEERERFVQEACRGEPELLERVRALLAAHES